MASPITVNKTLLGLDTVAPLVNTLFVYAYSSGVEPLTNNQVRILVDTNTAQTLIELPPISSFNGNYDVQIIVQDITGGASTKPIFVNNALVLGVPSGDLINGNSTGWQISSNYGSMTLTISSEGRWIATGYGTSTQ
jgi:hypothetical protein